MRLALLIAIVIPLLGCGYRRPLLQPPGPIHYQRQNASLHDPYADNDLGPEVVGSRPREFQKPFAEPVRNRSLSDSWWRVNR